MPDENETTQAKPMVIITVMFEQTAERPGTKVFDEVSAVVNDIPGVQFDFRVTTLHPSQIVRSRNSGLLRQSS